MTDYCTASDVKTRLGTTVPAHESQIVDAITASSRWIDDYCGRSFGVADEVSARTFRATSTTLLDLNGNDISTPTGLIVKTDSGDSGTFGTTWASTDYELEPLNGLKSGAAWPYTDIRAVGSYAFPVGGKRARVQVTAKWGWASVPDRVAEACSIRAAALFLRKQSPTGVMDGFGEFGPTRVSRFTDPDVADLLRPFRIVTQIAPIG